MADRRPPYDRRPTRPKQRAQLAPIARAEPPPEENQDDVVTKTLCPLCRQGMVSPEVAATFTSLTRSASERP